MASQLGTQHTMQIAVASAMARETHVSFFFLEAHKLADWLTDLVDWQLIDWFVS